MTRSSSLEVSGASETRRRKSKKISWANLDSLEEGFREEQRSEEDTLIQDEGDKSERASVAELERLVRGADRQEEENSRI